MNTKTLADATSFNHRLSSLLGQERRVQVEFLLALSEFAERRLYLDLGYSSLWDYCLRALHLREGATFLRTHAVALLRRFPALDEPLRDGRLCLSTLVELEPVLTEANFSEVIERAAYRTKAEVRQLVVSLAPKPAPVDSLRRAPVSAARMSAPAPIRLAAPAPLVVATTPPPAAPPRPRPAEMAPLSGDEWLIRMRLSERVRGKLETARALSSHAIADGSWEAVLEAALDCYIEKLEKRCAAKTERPRSTVATATEQASRPERGNEEHGRPPIPAAVRRAVWARDGGCCAFAGPDGTRCGSRHRLELDHVVPVARGGASTVANLRLLCRRHNVREAEHLFGEAFMRQFAPG